MDYTDDFQDRLVAESVDPDGDGEESAAEQFFVYDGQLPSPVGRGVGGEGAQGVGQVLLRFDGSEMSDLKDRYVWGPTVDLLLSDEKVSSPSTPGDVYWALADNLNTVRDIAEYDSQNDVTTIANHRVYDAFGNLTSQTNASVDCLFGFTGRQFDPETGLQYNLTRWYDPKTGRWLSQDRIGFKAGETNLNRYVWNRPTSLTDPTGRDGSGGGGDGSDEGDGAWMYNTSDSGDTNRFW